MSETGSRKGVVMRKFVGVVRSFNQSVFVLIRCIRGRN